MKNQDYLYLNLYKEIVKEIQNGILKKGTKLSSVRKIADEKGISRNTVLSAYNQLLSEGYIYSEEKKGFFVSDIEPFSKPVLKENIKSDKKEENSEKPKNNSANTVINLSSNLIDTGIFPYSTLKQLYRENLSGKNSDILKQTGDFRGEYVLRKAISDYLYVKKGVISSADQIIIGGGSAAILQSIIRLLENYIFILENPCYSKTESIIRDLGCRTVKIEQDSSGIKTDSLYNLKEEKAVLHITPSHQFPLGITMPVSRRSSILKWSYEKENRFIIEDDYDSDFRYIGHQIPSMQSLDTKGKVIYIGTFSRTLTPSLRISYAVLPEKIAALYFTKYSNYTSSVSRLDQKVVSDFITQGFYDRHINRAKKIYKAKRELFISELKKSISEKSIKGTEAGLHFIVEVENEKNVISECEKKGIFVQGTGKNHLIIGYAHLTDDEILTSSKILRSILEQHQL